MRTGGGLQNGSGGGGGNSCFTAIKRGGGWGGRKSLSHVKGEIKNSFEVVLLLDTSTHAEGGRKKCHPFKRGHKQFYSVSRGRQKLLKPRTTFCRPPSP